ncbi:hypothetical protein WICPIJ_008781 [Wickerhamomyces pijperi]|uniref:Uncharacterized protein n=1 Tax=Wickerhamomyces pijperi TaxID=599730 RepID=A0A9P8PUZ7_WICPI|nr:hypothetical protein WICPIJ_008781 [Wickerhamomyces pijperi]
MTAFITEGNPLIPPFLMAMTKGEAEASAELVPSNLLSLELTKREIIVNEPKKKNTILQKTCLMAEGKNFLALPASALVTPTNSVPPKE